MNKMLAPLDPAELHPGQNEQEATSDIAGKIKLMRVLQSLLVWVCKEPKSDCANGSCDRDVAAASA
jgi:hypothetical protein